MRRSTMAKCVVAGAMVLLVGGWAWVGGGPRERAAAADPYSAGVVTMTRQGGRSERGLALVVDGEGTLLAFTKAVGPGMGQFEVQAGAATTRGEVIGYDPHVQVLVARADPQVVGAPPTLEWKYYEPDLGEQVEVLGPLTATEARPSHMARVSAPAVNGPWGAAFDGKPTAFEIDMPFDPALIGAPVLNGSGAVVGLYCDLPPTCSDQSMVVRLHTYERDVTRIAARGGRVIHASLGMEGGSGGRMTETGEWEMKWGVVKVTPGGAAETAGIRAGDELLSFNGCDLTRSGPHTLNNMLAEADVGQRVPVIVQRGGRQLTLTVVFQARPDPSRPAEPPAVEEARDEPAVSPVW